MNVEKNPPKKMFEVYKNGGKVNDAILRLFIISAWILGVFFFSTETIERVRLCLSSTLNFMIHHALSTFFLLSRCFWFERIHAVGKSLLAAGYFIQNLISRQKNEWDIRSAGKKNYQATIPTEMRNNGVTIKRSCFILSLCAFKLMSSSV